MSYVYIIHAKDTDMYKIGLSDAADARLKSLQAGSPIELYLLKTKYFEDARPVEARLHNMFAEQRTHYEWFCLDGEQMESAINYLENYERYSSKAYRDMQMHKDGFSKTRIIKEVWKARGGPPFQTASAEFDEALRILICARR